MTTICLGATAVPGTMIRTRVVGALTRSLWVSITSSGQTARNYALHPPVESREEILRRARVKMLRMRAMADLRRRSSPDYPDDEQALVEQAAVASALMPLQVEAMRDTSG